MDPRAHEDHNFRSDLLTSKSCSNPSCRRVSEHASRLMHAAVLLKTFLIQQHQNQTSFNSNSHLDNPDATIPRFPTDYAALQRQVEAGLVYQREVQQLRKELEFHRDAIVTYKQLLNDGTSLREELRSELTAARKSASIARAALEQEKRNANRHASSGTSSPPNGFSRWFETYKEEAIKLRESVRLLTNKEMELSGLISRLKHYTEAELQRMIKIKQREPSSMFSGSWFLGLLGLLGLSCPSALEKHLLTPPVSVQSPQRRPSKRRRCNISVSSSFERHQSALESVLSELDEINSDAVVKTPDKGPQQLSRTTSSSSGSSNFVDIPVSRKLNHAGKRIRRDAEASPSIQQIKVAQTDLSSATHQKSRKLPEIGVCFSLSDYGKSGKKNETNGSGGNCSPLLQSKAQSPTQVSQPSLHSPMAPILPVQANTDEALNGLNDSSETAIVDLDDTEHLPMIENHPLTESEFPSPVLRPSSSSDKSPKSNSEKVETRNENHSQVNGLKEPQSKKKVEKSRKSRKIVPPVDLPSMDRVKTRPSVNATRQKKPLSLPTSLAEIITANFSEPIFNWFNDLTTWKVDKETSSETPPQVLESKPASPCPDCEDKENGLPRKMSIPLGSCIGMESGIVSTPQPQSILENLIAHFAGQRAFDHSSAPAIPMDVVGEALIRALELVPTANSTFPPPPPDPVLRAASLLKVVGKPPETSAFTTWFRIRLNAKKNRRCLPRSPLQIYRLAQTAFLACDPHRREQLLYQLATFLLFIGYTSSPISCLLLVFPRIASAPASSLDAVYYFLAWREMEDSVDTDEFIVNMKKNSCWSSTPTVTSLRDIVSSLVDKFCYGTDDDADDTARALRLILTAHAFTELDVKKAVVYRFGLIGWLLKARLLNWINSLVKSMEDESAFQLLLRVCSLSIDVVLLAAQLDSRRLPPSASKKKISACQRGLLVCCERIFDVLTSLFTNPPRHISYILYCLLRLIPCLSDDQISRIRELVADLPVDSDSEHNSVGISSILPSFQPPCITRSIERLQISSNSPLAQWLRKLLSPPSHP